VPPTEADQEVGAGMNDADTTSVLVIEDDPTVAEIVVRYLEREGFSATWEADGGVGLELALSSAPDLVVLDLMLPGVDGMTICRQLREAMPVPIIMLTALGDETDRVLGLELGADDYLAKPFSPRELVARVKAVLRRAQGQGSPPPSVEILEVDDLVVDLGAREATQSGAVIQLTAREFDLLAFLVRHPRQAFRREELLQEVWGYSYGDASTVTVHIRRLREKIEDEPSHPRHIATVWGVGYLWDP
jgi:DNA-binding response OmpR family regulator